MADLPATSRSCGKQRNTTWLQPFVLIGAPLYLFVNLFAFPCTPFLLSGDQVYFWMYAQRMLHGERIYQDFFQFTPPGVDVFYWMLFKLFGPHLWVTNGAVFLTGIALCWVCFSIARLLMDESLALLVTFLFLVLIYARLMNATHHWFSLLAVLCAARIVMRANTRLRIAIAGVLLGIASFFTQTAGFAGCIALILAFAWDRLHTRQSWRRILGNQLLLLTVFGVVFAALNLYLVARLGFQRLWYFQVTYPKHYLAYWFGTWFPGLPEPLTLRRLPHLAGTLFVYALLPVIYPVVLWRCWRERNQPRLRDGTRPALLALVGSFLLLEIIAGVNWLRLYAISMPGLILLVWIASRGKAHRYIQVTCWIIIGCLAVGQTWSRYRQDNRIARLPAGDAILSTQHYEVYSWLMQHTKPGDLFFQAAWPGVYLPLGLRNPVFVDALLTDEQTRPEFVDRSLRQLEQKQVKYILWSPRLDDPDSPTPRAGDHLGPFRAYLKSHYTCVKVFSNSDEIWERTAFAG